MILPDYWLNRPPFEIDSSAQSACEQLLTRAIANGPHAEIEYTLSIPKWQFLCYVADHHQFAFHGSSDLSITIFEPRQSNDLNDFGNQKAVYAAGDALWAMFFAVIDRDRYPMSMNNACIRLVDSAGTISDPFYIFSISQSALPRNPWRTGAVYILPPATFVAQPPLPFGDYEVRIPQLASFEAVTPLARLTINPEDFPFLAQIRGHDDNRLQAYASALQTGGPWPE